LLRVPAGGRTGALYITGGRNVVINGGTLSVAPNAPIPTSEDPSLQAEVRIFNVKGTKHFWAANLLIANPTNREFDVLVGGGSSSTWTLQNWRVENQLGRYNGVHADVVQPWNGGLSRLRIDRMTLQTNYQGIYLDGLPVPNGITFQRMNLVHTEPNNSSLFWLGGKRPTWSQVYVISDRRIEGDGASGGWIRGVPPNGDFVPAGSVG
jgi:hypothetical protein